MRNESSTGSGRKREAERQRRSNRNADRQAGRFRSHREQLTRLAVAAAPAPTRTGRLCVLGAGNANDLDLERLVATYREVHLVDLDGEALGRARDRQSATVRASLVTHAGVDLSQLLDQLEPLRALRVNVERIAAHPLAASQAVARRLGAPFETVLSACVLSQMHLALRSSLSDAHPLFEALTYTLNVTHLQTLHALSAPGGRSLLASDAADQDLAPVDGIAPDVALDLLRHLAASGDLYTAVNPVALGTILADSPDLSRSLRVEPIRDAWSWEIAEGRCLLVYVLELLRLAT
jgi:hypothetical protein